jgi:molybdopterin synthase catalytic subunit
MTGNSITLLFFATIKEKTGSKTGSLEIPEGCRVADLKRLLCEKYPALKGTIDRTLVAVNQNYALDDELVPMYAEVALFPPVSGGSPLPTVVAITYDPIGMDDLLAQLSTEAIGAACLFTGIVRGRTLVNQAHHSGHHHYGENHEQGLEVHASPDGPVTQTVSLEYEAYEPMARQKMLQIAAEIRERWPAIYGIGLIQRIGLLTPVTPTVVVACTAAHRDTGVFEAARYGIDRLKEIVPIWKKEIGPNGETWIEGDYIPSDGD